MQCVALMVMAVEAVDFIRWMPPQRHFGVDAGGTGVGTTLFGIARAHHPLPVRAAVVCEAPACGLTWSQFCAHDLSMSLWRHLETRFVMLEPPPAVRCARAFNLQWL